MTVFEEEVPANLVPAAAVIREGQALSIIIGRKAFVDGIISLLLNSGAQLWHGIRYCFTLSLKEKSRILHGEVEF